jgi:hypothetical protein
MDEKKEGLKNIELIKPYSNTDAHKRNISNSKIPKAKFSMKKVGRSRNQKGHKNY